MICVNTDAHGVDTLDEHASTGSRPPGAPG